MNSRPNWIVSVGMTAAAGLVILLVPAAAHEGHEHGAVAAPPARQDVRAQNAGAPMPPAPSGPPHQGQVKSGWQHVVEVVYLPQQIRVYLYDTQGRPLSPQGVVGDVAMEVNGNPRQWWWRLEQASSGDHLLVNVDLSRVKDRDMVAIFELKNLPNREEPQVRFAQLFAISQANSDAEKFASSVRSDSLRLARQAADTPSATKGTALSANLVALYGVRPGVSAVQAAAADQRWIAEQRICPVTKQPLGSMGVPWRVTVEGQTVYVCCQACVQEIEKDPLFYIRLPSPDASGSSRGGCSSGGCSSGGCSSCRAR